MQIFSSSLGQAQQVLHIISSSESYQSKVLSDCESNTVKNTKFMLTIAHILTQAAVLF